MIGTGTLESFYPTLCYSKALNSGFSSGLGKTTNSSSETSPLPSHHIRKKQLEKRLKSVSSKSTDYDVYPTKRDKQHNLSSTPAPKLRSSKKMPKINCQKNKEKPLELNTKARGQTPEIKFVQLKEKVRNELMLKCNYHIMRSIKKNMRSDEYKVSGLYLDSTQLFNRLSARMDNPDKSIQPFKVTKNYGTGKLIHKKSLADSKVLGQTTSEWINKHGKLTDSLSVKSTAKIIFDMLDPDGKGEITGNQFCEFLIEIGFPLDIFTTFFFVKAYKHCQDIESIKLNVEDIGNFCRADHRTDSILDGLYVEAGELDSEKYCMVDIVTLFRVINDWWKELDKATVYSLHCNEVCEFLVQKGVACDFSEAYKITSKCAVNSYLDFTHFQLVFVKAFIKHLLINIQYRFSTEDWSNQDFSSAYKLCLLKRQLILAGILYPVPQISYEEGQAALSAIKKYKEFQKKPIISLEYSKFCIIWKELTGEILGKTYMKPNLDEESLEPFKKNMNLYTIIGNTDVKYKVKKKWEHSFEPECKLKEFAAINKGEVRFLKENKLIKDFCGLVNYEI